MSVWTRLPVAGSGARWKRRARPRGLPFGLESGREGMPVEEEKRARRGTEGRVKCGAREREEAVGLGMKVPVRRMPFAWTGGGKVRTGRWERGGRMGEFTWTDTGGWVEDVLEGVKDGLASLADGGIR